MPISIYILQCANNTYFTGITLDLKNRLNQHRTGYYRRCYTYNKRPVKLVYHCEFNESEPANARYAQIKKWSQAKKAALIHGDRAALPDLAKKKF